MDALFAHWHTVIAVIAALVLILSYKAMLWLCGVIIVPDDSIGVVTKKFVLFGKHANLPDGRIVALAGEAGFQADTLAPGLHVGLWPWQFSVDIVRFITIPQGKIGCVEACDGKPLPAVASSHGTSLATRSKTHKRSSAVAANAVRR